MNKEKMNPLLQRRLRKTIFELSAIQDELRDRLQTAKGPEIKAIKDALSGLEKGLKNFQEIFEKHGG